MSARLSSVPATRVGRIAGPASRTERACERCGRVFELRHDNKRCGDCKATERLSDEAFRAMRRADLEDLAASA